MTRSAASNPRVLRKARLDDIPAMHRVRLSVRENRLTSSAITESDYVPFIAAEGSGWVVEVGGVVVGFAVGNVADGNIWALFVDPLHEGRGHGRQLHDAVVSWLWSRGLARLWLDTEPDTRASRFYAAAGWQPVGTTARGELRLELDRPRAPPAAGLVAARAVPGGRE